MKNELYLILSVFVILAALCTCAAADDTSTVGTDVVTTTDDVTTTETTTTEVTTPEVTPEVVPDYMANAEEFLAALLDNDNYAMSADDLIAEMESVEIVILDVRSLEMFAEDHIEGSINIPLPMLLDQIDTIPADKTIAVVCMSDANSAFAVSILRIFGEFDAYVVTGGVQAVEDAIAETVTDTTVTDTTVTDTTVTDTTVTDTTETDTTETKP